MPLTIRRSCARALAATAVALTLGGCVSTTPDAAGYYARPVGGAPVIANPTPYSAGLRCLADYAARYHAPRPRIAVGRLSDLTGKLDDITGSRTVTQGGALMAMSALGKAGVPLVERYETDVSKLEYQLADNKLISDEPLQDGRRRDYRPVHAGEISGSDLFLTGGITELNSNIRTRKVGADLSKADGEVSVGRASADGYVMNVALDVRLVSTRTLDVVDIVSYQKQIVGRHLGGDLFSFFGSNVLKVSAAGGREEPVHLAVRSLIERAVLEMLTRAYGLPPGACLNPANDPLAVDVVMDRPSPPPGMGAYAAAGLQTPAPAYGRW